MNKYEKNNHKKGKMICLIVFGVSFLFIILFSFLYYNELKKRPLVKYPTYSVSSNYWTTDNIIVTITNPSDKVMAYSFDGGNTFQDSNEFTVVENGTYEVVVKDINGRLSKKISVIINNIDRDPPEITVENSTTIQLGNPYNVRTGVVVKDELSGLGSDYATVPASIDTSKEGTYTITYSAFDKAGNSSQKTRTIIVKDIKGNTYYRYRTATIESYQCEPYNCKCNVASSAKENQSCPTGYVYDAPDKCCQTCYKTCKKTIWSEWSEWSKKKIDPSSTREVETKVE